MNVPTPPARTDPAGPTPVGPVDATEVPRYAGIATFARLPRLDEVPSSDVAVVGVPFDTGVSYRPGARFGPAAVREASRLLRPYHPALDVQPFHTVQVADAGDVGCSPFDIPAAIGAIQRRADELTATGARRAAGPPGEVAGWWAASVSGVGVVIVAPRWWG